MRGKAKLRPNGTSKTGFIKSEVSQNLCKKFTTKRKTNKPLNKQRRSNDDT